MSGSNATKEDVERLMKQRKDKEEELKAHLSTLEVNKVGMEEALVDSEGFPRNDLDVYQVRKARHQIICLRNDLKSLMVQIEQSLHSLHAQSREGIGVNHPDAVPCQGLPRQPIPQTFAKVDKVDDNSPASEAGLLAGDELSAFGSVNTENFVSMKLLSEVTYRSKNKSLDLEIVRLGNRVKKLTLMPREWSGRGLLGCNIVPNEQHLDR